MNISTNFWLFLIVVLASCSSDVPEQNQSPIRSISVNSSTFTLLSYNMDNTGKYLFLYGNKELEGNRVAKVLKIDLDKLEIVQESDLTEKHKFIGANNVRFNSQNQMFLTLRGMNFSEELVAAYDEDLNPLASVNIPGGDNRSRRRLAINSNNEVVVAHTYKDPNPNIEGGALLNYYNFDQNLSPNSYVVDTSMYRNDFLLGTEHIGLEDGGTLFVSRLINAPSYNNEILVEKRDASLNLVWRHIIEQPGNQYGFSTIEHNGRILISGHGVDDEDNFQNKLFIYEFDQNGNHIHTKKIDDGAVLTKLIEPIMSTEDGGFLISGVTTHSTSMSFQKGVLFKLDQNLNVQKSYLYGSHGSVSESGFVRVADNRYLLFYLDNGFSPDGASFRLVFQYLDQNLNIQE